MLQYQTVNPATNEVVATFPNATDEEILDKVAKAHDAFLDWRNTPLADRAAVLAKAADLLRADKQKYADILTLEMGKLTAEALGEVDLSADILQYFADHIDELLAPRVLPVADPAEGKAQLVTQPLGVVYLIEPWNFPYYQIARAAAPQIAAGNTVILKHAEIVPQAAQAFDDLFREAGAPEGVFANVFATHEHTKLVLEDDRVVGVALTGSERAGSAVASVAGAAMKKATLELGGSDAFIVLDDADLDKAVHLAVRGRNWNAGQVCVSAKRIIVVDALYDEFLEKYIAEANATIKPGDPKDPETTMAPLSSQRAKEMLTAQVDGAVAAGATKVEVGAPIPAQGAYYQPAVLTGVTPENPAYHQELFGPVATFYRAKDEDDAVSIANDSPYGLGGSVFTADEARGVEVAKRIDTGMVFVNHPTGVFADIPFGGIKRSGFGNELIDLGFDEFVNKKLIDVQDINTPF
ncbi:NAD-dependent succinate-semialdehyde dehydrogenase [Pseudoclavibacter sp. CFCC 11306]|uniref:NAD-dependent succinate-semialdehyde dehydrogenase n=1 Tax=Pseudoclavibacter sp. CFCC 11306 TaxID=1564493 RepID=UPI001CE3B655|nr:NAD-dependent succinate-semialdehyde dehydrogenase [Pseudoclavibacter sp. CFCC 11306]